MSRDWTAQIVEDLLFRQFVKKEDITTLCPPTPSALSTHKTSAFRDFDEATKILNRYLNTGPKALISATSTHKINSITTPSACSADTQLTPTTRGPAKPQPRTPKGKENQSELSRAGPGQVPKKLPDSPSPTPKGKKRRMERWAQGVPHNSALLSKKHSAVAIPSRVRIQAQDGVDPDLFFEQPRGEFPLLAIFAQHPDILKRITVSRGITGDWRSDTFTSEEEVMYKEEVGLVHIGPSQTTHKFPF